MHMQDNKSDGVSGWPIGECSRLGLRSPGYESRWRRNSACDLYDASLHNTVHHIDMSRVMLKTT